MPNIETAPTKETPQTSHKKLEQVQTDVHDSMSNTSLSMTDIIALKIKKIPLRLLKGFISL